MARGTKTIPISQTKHIMLTVCDKNKASLAYFERKVMKANHITDCCLVNNADVINEALNVAFEFDRPKKRGPRGFFV